MVRPALPSRSPTTRFSWAAATRSRDTGPRIGAAWGTEPREPARHTGPVKTVTALRDPGVVAAIESAADATLARTTLERMVAVEPDVAAALVDEPPVRDGLIAVVVASRSLTNALIGDPSLLDVLRHLDEPAAVDPSDPGALRRTKRRELLR